MNSEIENNKDCLGCGQKGLRVKFITLESLVKKECLGNLKDSADYLFCASINCEVVYFELNLGVAVNRDELKVSVGQKEIKADRQICYCFDFTADAIEKDFLVSGKSNFFKSITERCRNGEDSCAQKNPQGTCCLGNVREVIGKIEVNSSDDSKLNVVVLAQMGALLTAILASACCWLPLLLVGLGFSSSALTVTFESWQPLMMPITLVLLAMAYYLSYGGSSSSGDCCAVEKDEEGGCCSPSLKKRPMKKINRLLFWVVTLFVLGVMFYPFYANSLQEKLDFMEVSLKGVQTQDAAEVVESALLKVNNVVTTKVDLKDRVVTIGFKKGDKVSVGEVFSVIAKVGDYEGRLTDQVTWKLIIEGMTCGSCSSMVKSKMSKLKGVYSAKVNFKNGEAIITTNNVINEDQLKKVVTLVGYELLSITKIKNVGAVD